MLQQHEHNLINMAVAGLQLVQGPLVRICPLPLILFLYTAAVQYLQR